jgi:hypothetical protein
MSVIEEPYWRNSAKQLAALFARIPGLKDSDLGDDPQRFLAEYVPPARVWDQRTEDLRARFLSMGEPQFRGIYNTFLERRNMPDFNTR